MEIKWKPIVCPIVFQRCTSIWGPPSRGKGCMYRQATEIISYQTATTWFGRTSSIWKMSSVCIQHPIIQRTKMSASHKSSLNDIFVKTDDKAAAQRQQFGLLFFFMPRFMSQTNSSSFPAAVSSGEIYSPAIKIPGIPEKGTCSNIYTDLFPSSH